MTTANTMADTTPSTTAAQLAFGRYRSGEAIRADDPNAAEKLTAKIKLLTDTRQAIKDINAALRLKAVVIGNEKLRAGAGLWRQHHPPSANALPPRHGHRRRGGRRSR